MKPTKPKHRLIIHYLLMLLTSVACVPEYVPPDDYKDFSTWRSAVSDAPVKSSFKMLGHANEIVMCVQRKKGKEYFTGLNVNNGKVLWQTLVPNGDSVAVADAHIHGSNYVFYADGKIRNINLQTGSYNWEVSDYNILVPDITGLGEHFYFSAQSKTEPRLGAIFQGNVLTGQIEGLVLAPYTDSLATSTVSGIIGRVSRVDAADVNGQTKLIVQSSFRRYSHHEFWDRQNLGFYNIQNNSWEWNILSLAEHDLKKELCVARYHNGKIFTSIRDYSWACLDAVSAELIWERSSIGGISDIAIIDDELVFFYGIFLAGFKINDGQLAWSTHGDEYKRSKINTFKNMMYASTDETGFGLKSNSGRPYWFIKLQGPTHRKNNNLKGECVVVPIGNGDDAMVIYTSDLEVYAYKALNP